MTRIQPMLVVIRRFVLQTVACVLIKFRGVVLKTRATPSRVMELKRHSPAIHGTFVVP